MRKTISTRWRLNSIVATVHAETSTGVRSDIKKLGAALRERDERTLLLADCVTSIGGEQIELDSRNVDIACAGTQKCLGVPPGPARLVGRPTCHQLVRKTQSSGSAAGPLLTVRPAGQLAR